MDLEAESGPFFHGTKAQLELGMCLQPGHKGNYGDSKKAKYIYFSASLESAIWGAELAQGENAQRIYIVIPQGPFEDDPNLTNKKYPGNPTRSYRSKSPLRIMGEIRHWPPLPEEKVRAMRLHLETLRKLGTDTIED